MEQSARLEYEVREYTWDDLVERLEWWQKELEPIIEMIPYAYNGINAISRESLILSRLESEKIEKLWDELYKALGMAQRVQQSAGEICHIIDVWQGYIADKVVKQYVSKPEPKSQDS